MEQVWSKLEDQHHTGAHCEEQSRTDSVYDTRYCASKDAYTIEEARTSKAISTAQESYVCKNANTY